MDHPTTLGLSSSTKRSLLGLGAMTRGEPQGLARFHLATMAYGGAHGYEEEKRALEASLEAGINLVDTAAFYSAEPRKRAGELAQGIDVLIMWNSVRAPVSSRRLPRELAASLNRLGRPTSTSTSIISRDEFRYRI